MFSCRIFVDWLYESFCCKLTKKFSLISQSFPNFCCNLLDVFRYSLYILMYHKLLNAFLSINVKYCSFNITNLSTPGYSRVDKNQPTLIIQKRTRYSVSRLLIYRCYESQREISFWHHRYDWQLSLKHRNVRICWYKHTCCVLFHIDNINKFNLNLRD